MPELQAATAAREAPEKARLDDVMLAMDVVDTLRHQDALVARELDETRREAELIERLRRIYASQGISVPDRVLREGVAALKESRFVYTPPAPGLARTLAVLWVTRARWAKTAGIAMALVLIAFLGYRYGIDMPVRQAAEQARQELTVALPAALEARHRDAVAEARVPEARDIADDALRDGRAALARDDAAGARAALARLDALRADLARAYELRIVSRPGEPSGVWRVPDVNRRARNYYVVVDAVAPDGSRVSVPIESEETGRIETVSRFGVRVTADTFNAVRRDKEEDGIVSNDLVGVKRRGELEVRYAMPVRGGFITQW